MESQTKPKTSVVARLLLQKIPKLLYLPLSQVSGADDSTKFWSLKLGGCSLLNNPINSPSHLPPVVFQELGLILVTVHYTSHTCLLLTGAPQGKEPKSPKSQHVLHCCQGIRTMSDTPEGCLAVDADWAGQRGIAGCGDGTIRHSFPHLNIPGESNNQGQRED